MKINFFTPNTLTRTTFSQEDWDDVVMTAIVKEFAYQSQNAQVCQIDGGPLLTEWQLESDSFSTVSEIDGDVYEDFVSFQDIEEIHVLGPGKWKFGTTVQTRNGNLKLQESTSVSFFTLTSLVPNSLPEGWREYCESDTTPEKFGLVDIIYNDGSMDTCCRPDEIIWTSFAVKGWKPCAAE